MILLHLGFADRTYLPWVLLWKRNPGNTPGPSWTWPLFSTKWIWKMYELVFRFWHFVEGRWVCSASVWCGRPSFCSVSSFITAKMAPQKWVWVPSFCSTWQPWGLPLDSDFVEALFWVFAGFLICNYKMAVPNPTGSIGGGMNNISIQWNTWICCWLASWWYYLRWVPFVVTCWPVFFSS